MSLFMKNGIFREDEGFDIVVEGVNRTFSDTQQGAFEMARNLKGSFRQSRIQIRTRADGLMRERYRRTGGRVDPSNHMPERAGRGSSTQADMKEAAN
jgi:hypothetical protein